VNWVKAVNAPPPRQVDHGLLSAFADLGADLSDVLDNEVLLTSRAHVNEMRYNDNRLYYPAVSAPLGSDDELVCPEPHVRFLQGKLKSLRELSLLVVGYSGLDREVLDLLRASNSSLRSLAVVAESKESADLTAARVMDQFDSVSAPPELYAEGFSTWAQAGALDEYFERLMKGTRDS
jgi:hypothetical protein